MYEFFIFIRDVFVGFIDLLDSYSFNIAGMNTSLFEIMFGLLALGIIISVFWKGGRA